MTHCRYDGGSFKDLDVVHRESDLMRGSLHFEEMDFIQMDHDVALDATNFM